MNVVLRHTEYLTNGSGTPTVYPMPMSDWKNELVDLLCRGENDAAIALRQRHLPSSIFRYRSYCPNDFSALERGTVWMSSPDSFNDLHDAKVSLMGKFMSTITRAIWPKIIGLTFLELQDAANSPDFKARCAEIFRNKHEDVTKKPFKTPHARMWCLVPR